MVNFLSEFIDDERPGKKKRIRSKIDYAVKKDKIKTKVKNDGRYYIATEFFGWAIEEWSGLEKIENLPLPDVMHGILPAQEMNLALPVQAVDIPSDYDELRKQYLKRLKKLQICKIEIGRLTKTVYEQHEELIELRAYKENIRETNRASGSMPKTYK